MVAAENAGVNVPLLIAKLLRLALEDAALVTVTVYVCVVIPSCAVTIVVMVLPPTFKAIADEALPLATVVPLTVTVAVALLTAGVRVNDVTALTTEAVYPVVSDEKAGLNVPLLIVRPARLASVDGGLVTIVVYVCVVVPS